MQKATWRLIAVTAGLIGLASPVLSEDLSPPCWRNQPGSTYQNWGFGTSANPASPDLQYNAGSPQANIVLGFFGSGWLNDVSPLSARQGLWDLGSSGSIALTIPDTAGSVNGYRYVVAQVTEFQDPGTYSQLADVTINVPGSTLVSRSQTLVETDVLGAWYADRVVFKVPSAPASQTVTVQAPAASGALIDQVVVDTLTIDYPCPGNIMGVADPGQCSKSNVGWVLPPVDGCVITNVVNITNGMPASNPATFPVGDTVVTSTVTDAMGYGKVCTFNVHIDDTQLPVVICPPDIIVFKEPGYCGAHVSFIVNATDNCLVTNITSTPASGSLFPLGVTTVTSTAKDSSGNQSVACQFTVRVIDLSGDLAAAPCWRGQAGSTYQAWAFSTSANPATAEVYTNTAGVPQAAMSVGFFGGGWLEDVGVLGCRQGLWDLGSFGNITASIPEAPGSVNGYRYVVVQVSEYHDPGTYSQFALTAVPGATLVSSNMTPVETNTFGYIWYVERTVWKLNSAPASEVVTVTAPVSGALIDQVVVDTLTIDYPCPGNIMGVADPGQCSKSNVTWTLPALDGCKVTNMVCVPPSGSSFPVGTTPVTCQIADAFGGIRVCMFNVIITDSQPPVISAVLATEVQAGSGTVTVKNCANPAYQGVVNIAVQAADNCPLVGGHPSVNLTNGADFASATFVNESPIGTFNYTWTVGPSTTPGTWTATVAAADSATTVTSNFTVCVDVSLISGQIELEGFVGTTRTVTFVATGGTMKTWTVPLTFSGAIANYAVAGVPAGTTGISAKTDWSLRRKLAVTLNLSNQGVANFTGASRLLGGDLDGNNRVSTTDFLILNTYWQTTDPTADINGSGSVTANDYFILSNNWQTDGDPQ